MDQLSPISHFPTKSSVNAVEKSEELQNKILDIQQKITLQKSSKAMDRPISSQGKWCYIGHLPHENNEVKTKLNHETKQTNQPQVFKKKKNK